MQQALELIQYKGDLFAIIVRADYHAEGIEFFTPYEFSQQLAYVNYPPLKWRACKATCKPHVDQPEPWS